MDKKVAETLLGFVNAPHNVDDLKAYAAHRIEIHRTTLETARDADEILRVQGAIRELRRLSSLQDEVRGAAKDR